jgi:hypothetical protein
MISIEKALDKAEPVLQRSFLAMVQTMRGALDLTEIAQLLETGQLERAFSTILQATPKLANSVNDQFIMAANTTARQLDRAIDVLTFDFNQTNEWAVQQMRSSRLRLISGFSQGQRAATRQALIEGITRGANPIEQARTFRDSIGLTARQVRAVRNYRNALETGSSDALARELRDRRFDPTVRADRPLTSKQVDKITERYRQRMLAHRSKVIARTEALRSVHEGKDAMFQQAIESGQLEADNLIQEWNTARDERVRGSHAAMHGQTRRYGERFVSGDGHETLHPGGFGIPSEDIQCRCTVSTRIVSLDAMEAQAEILV